MVAAAILIQTGVSAEDGKEAGAVSDATESVAPKPFKVEAVPAEVLKKDGPYLADGKSAPPPKVTVFKGKQSLANGSMEYG